MTASATDRPTAGASELFQLFRSETSFTRAELVELTGLSRTTVGVRLDALASANLIEATDSAASSGGRPASRLAMAKGSRVVGGVDLGATHATASIADLSGAIIGTVRERRDITSGPEASLDWIAQAIAGLTERAGYRATDVMAIGIGLPGPVEHETGRPVNPPIMPGWNDFDVPGAVRERLGTTALVDNDVNLMAVGERTVAWPGVKNLLFVKVATGIGAGIISGGHLQRGAQGVAGDIGHVAVPRGLGVLCRCGNEGCLEAVAGGPAVAAAASATSTADLVRRIQNGDTTAALAARQAGRDIGHVLSVAISMINPSVIVLGGSLALAGEHLMAGVREAVYARSAPIATEHLTISPSVVGGDAAIVGACHLAIEHALSPSSIETLLSGATMES